jgi:predicted ribosomally synthesized peptide with nif11-like leader
MSEKLQQFQEKVAATPELQKQVAASAGNLNKMAEIAQTAGFDISFEELKDDLHTGVAKVREKPEVQAFVKQHPEAHRFYYQAFHEDALHTKFAAAGGDNAKLAQVAQEAGFNLDADAIEIFRTGLNEAGTMGELSDDDLDAVAGGGLFGAIFGAVVGAAVGAVVGTIVGACNGDSGADLAKDAGMGAAGGAIDGAVEGACMPEP